MAGRYLKQSEVKKPKKKGLKIALIILAVVIVLIVAAVIAVPIYLKSMLGHVTTVDDVTLPPVVTTEPLQISGEDDFNYEEIVDETWTPVESPENLTTFMLVGQNFRGDEAHRLSDTMILCTVNRETKTLTMTSILRDTYVPLPAYAGHGTGRNRINVCYHLGTEWTGSVKGGMEMLALCVEKNFGIPVDHTVEVGFDAFEQIVDLMGGVEIELTEAEANYINNYVGYVLEEMSAGRQTLTGTQALAYARIRHIDSDFARTDRQRKVITSLLKKCMTMSPWDLNKMATEILPLIVTDMSSEQMFDYIMEFLPMLLDLNIVSQSVPLDKTELQTIVPGTWSFRGIEVEGIGNVLEPNLTVHRQYLQQQLGYSDADLEEE